jgi:hypothetical protein
MAASSGKLSPRSDGDGAARAMQNAECRMQNEMSNAKCGMRKETDDRDNIFINAPVVKGRNGVP